MTLSKSHCCSLTDLAGRLALACCALLCVAAGTGVLGSNLLWAQASPGAAPPQASVEPYRLQASEAQPAPIPLMAATIEGEEQTTLTIRPADPSEAIERLPVVAPSSFTLTSAQVAIPDPHSIADSLLIEAAEPPQTNPQAASPRRLFHTISQTQSLPEGDAADANRSAPSAAGKGSLASGGASGQQKLGQAPVDYSRQFLRTQSVLLRQGQCQFDTGIAYANVQGHFPDVVGGGALVEGIFRRRLAYIPVQVRYGLTDRVQLFANIPVGYTGTQQSVVGFYDINSARGGTGDTNLGVSYHLRQNDGCPFDPDIIVTGGFTIPTAPASFVSALANPQTSLGQGFWAGFWNVLVIQTHDPVTIFYGFGGRHLAGREINGALIQPGQQLNYQMGVGFAVNDRVTLSGMFLGSFITDTYFDRQRVPGTLFEPMYLRFAATVARTNKIVEPFALIGMTDDAARAIIGVNLTLY